LLHPVIICIVVTIEWSLPNRLDKWAQFISRNVGQVSEASSYSTNEN